LLLRRTIRLISPSPSGGGGLRDPKLSMLIRAPTSEIIAGVTSIAPIMQRRVTTIAPSAPDGTIVPGAITYRNTISVSSTHPAKIAVRPAVFAARVAACFGGSPWLSASRYLETISSE